MQVCVSCGIWSPLQVLGFSIQRTMTSLKLLPCLDGRIQIGRVTWILVVPLQVIVSLWDHVLSLGIVRSNPPSPFLLLKWSTGLPAHRLAKQRGFNACLRILAFLNKAHHLSCETIKVVWWLLAQLESILLPLHLSYKSASSLFEGSCPHLVLVVFTPYYGGYTLLRYCSLVTQALLIGLVDPMSKVVHTLFWWYSLLVTMAIPCLGIVLLSH